MFVLVQRAQLLALVCLSSCGREPERALVLERLRAGDHVSAAALLEGTSGPAADELYAELERLAEERRAGERELESLRRRTDQGDRSVRAELAVWRERVEDPRLRAAIEAEIERAAPPKGAARLAAVPGVVDARRAGEARDEVERAWSARDWKAAFARIESLRSEGADSLALELENATLARAEMEARLLLQALERADAAAQAPRAAVEELTAARARFPERPEFESLHRAALEGSITLEVSRAREPDWEAELRASNQNTEEPAGPAPTRPVRASELALTPELPLASSANDVETLRLVEQRARALRRAEEAPREFERRLWSGRAGDLAARIALRRALLHTLLTESRLIAELQVRVLDADGLELAGVRVGWESLFEVLSERQVEARLEPEALVGLSIERLVHGSQRQRELALQDLDRLAQNGSLSREEVDALRGRAAAARGPAGGFVERDGRWRFDGEAPDAEWARRTANQADLVTHGSAKAREASYRALLDEDEEALALAALELRWSKALERAEKAQGFRALEMLALARQDLDRARTSALELIFDEARYPYPPPEDRGPYEATQQEIDRRVGEVRGLIARTRRVDLSPGLLRALEELSWSRERAGELGRVLPLGDAPDWLGSIRAGTSSIGLAEFAWNAGELERLLDDESIEALNQRRFQSAAQAEHAPLESEFQQVRETNAYRRLLGRRALAWDLRLWRAARGHSVYMANSGHFGHDEPARERATPFDRMRAEGYGWGASENCFAGSAAPAAALAGWQHSAGHHRNLLSATLTELGVGAEADYWTQNFGAGRDFEVELDR